MRKLPHAICGMVGCGEANGDRFHLGRDVSAPNDDLQARLDRCQHAIGYRFQDPSLLSEALTHASGATSRSLCNERLEFLGDAILGAIVAEKLYHAFPDRAEGDLTRIRAAVVSRETCARVAEGLGLDRMLLVGKGIRMLECLPRSLLAGVLEAILGAIYLDGGMPAARRFVERHLVDAIQRAAAGTIGCNHKARLQEIAQRDFKCTPTYRVIRERGPDHAKSFQVVAVLGSRHFPPAWGRNKKEAEQLAAANALAVLRQESSTGETEPSEPSDAGRSDHGGKEG